MSKIRKLIRDPSLFFFDMHAKRHLKHNTEAKPHFEYDDDVMVLSLIVAAYNVEKYLDRCLASIFGQSSRLQNFEVIVVNDGSTDATEAIIHHWKKRYPKQMRLINQENAGPAAARNAGLAIAQGKWVGFPDSDDFLDVDYFKHMLAEITTKPGRPLLAVISNLNFYFEDRDLYSDSHPLRYRFTNGVVRKPSHELGHYMQLSAASCWFHGETLQKHSLSFDPRVVPSFEDAHFLNHTFLSSPNRTISFVPQAKYYYRKRSDKSSTIDGAKDKKTYFIDIIEFGYLDLLRTSQRTRGKVPVFIQRTCLYDMMWRIRRVVDHEENIAHLSDHEQSRFLELTKEVFSFIDESVIENFSLAGCTEEHKVALLALFKGQVRSSTAVYLQQLDTKAGMAQFAYHAGGDDSLDVRIMVNGREQRRHFQSQRTARLLGHTYFQQHFFWIPLGNGDEVSFMQGDVACRIRRGGNALGESATWLTLLNAIQPKKPDRIDAEAETLRAFITAKKAVYHGALVLMDREDKADDNAEHLYRHLMATGRADNAWFILSQESADWGRLHAEGFKLLPFGSNQHIAALCNADFLLSSHVDHHLLWPNERSLIADLARYQFVFLQHGVSDKNISRWLNRKPIRLLVTATKDEYAAILHPDGNYKFSDREVVLSGFPRHDTLLAKNNETNQDSILILPTWRKNLTEEYNRNGILRGKVENFLESDYAKNWIALLKSPDLCNLAERHGLRIVFAPHPNMAMYLEDMDLPDYIQRVDVREGVSYQKLFAQARIAITCFSSAATEVAYLNRPIVYFQFDRDRIFDGGHVYTRGNFSFDDDGFGPVVSTPQAVVAKVEIALQDCEDPVYARRREAAFPYRDGKCSERVCEAVEKVAGKSYRNEIIREFQSGNELPTSGFHRLVELNGTSDYG